MSEGRTDESVPRGPSHGTSQDLEVFHRYFPEGSLDELIVTTTRRMLLVARRYRKAIDSALHEIGHSLARWEILLALALKGGESTLTEVADVIGLESPSIVGPMEKLAQGDFVTRQTDERDRRSRRIALTAAGGEAVEQMRVISAQERAKLVEGVPPEDLETTLRVLTAMRENLRRNGIGKG